METALSSALKNPREPGPFRDLDLVVIARDVRTDDGALVAAGTQGTIVGRWAHGRSFEVEFASPTGTATLAPHDLRRVTAS